MIDTATNAVVKTITAPHYPAGVAVTPDGKNVYVGVQDNAEKVGSVLVIDTATNNVAATIKVENNPWGIVIGPSP